MKKLLYEMVKDIHLIVTICDGNLLQASAMFLTAELHGHRDRAHRVYVVSYM